MNIRNEIRLSENRVNERKVIPRFDDEELVLFFPQYGANKYNIVGWTKGNGHFEVSMEYFRKKTKPATAEESKEMMEVYAESYLSKDKKLIYRDRIYWPDMQDAWSHSNEARFKER